MTDILQKRQTCYLSTTQKLKVKPLDEKNHVRLKKTDLKVNLTGGRLPLVWTLPDAEDQHYGSVAKLENVCS